MGQVGEFFQPYLTLSSWKIPSPTHYTCRNQPNPIYMGRWIVYKYFTPCKTLGFHKLLNKIFNKLLHFHIICLIYTPNKISTQPNPPKPTQKV